MLEIDTPHNLQPGAYPITVTALSQGLPSQDSFETIEVNPGIIGVRNSVMVNDYAVSSTVDCPSLTDSCFSIQQNTVISGPENSFAYWVQNVIVVETDVYGDGEAYGAYNLFNFSDRQTPVDCFPNLLGACTASPFPALASFIPLPATWTLTTEINSNNQLVMTNPFFGTHIFAEQMP